MMKKLSSPASMSGFGDQVGGRREAVVRTLNGMRSTSCAGDRGRSRIVKDELLTFTNPPIARLRKFVPPATTFEDFMAFVCDIPAVPTVQRDDDDVRVTRWDFLPGPSPAGTPTLGRISSSC